ncbi:unnamed protein product [Eretmochelys imbricata]
MALRPRPHLLFLDPHDFLSLESEWLAQRGSLEPFLPPNSLWSKSCIVQRHKPPQKLSSSLGQSHSFTSRMELSLQMATQPTNSGDPLPSQPTTPLPLDNSPASPGQGATCLPALLPGLQSPRSANICQKGPQARSCL